MTERFFNDKELDRWLRENAGTGMEPPAPDGWDSPTEAVWTGLRAGLDRRKKHRRGLLIFWSLFLAGLSGGLGYWYAGGRNAAQPVQDTIANTALSTVEQTPVAPTPPVRNTAGQHANYNLSINTQTLPGAGRTSKHRPALLSSLPVAGGFSPADGAPPEKAAADVPPALLPASQEARLDLLPGIAKKLPCAVQKPVIAKASIRSHKTCAGFYASLQSGAFYTTRVLQRSGTQQPNGRESGAWTAQYGLSLGISLNRHWALETGIQRTAVRLQAERLIPFRYQTAREQFNAQNFVYQNTDEQILETSFGQVQMRMDISREPSRPIADQAIVGLTLRTDEQVQYLRIPLMLRWTDGSARWQWSLAAGLGINFESGYELQITAARANRTGVRNIRARLQNRANGLAPVVPDLQLGAGLQYRLSPAFALALQPEFRYGLGALYQNGPFRALALSGGVQLGMIWQIKGH